MAILDGELLRAFAAFAKTRSFTRAAASIGLSQPAMFERVKRLSERLGRPLYTRVARELVLTEDGEEVAAFARDALSRATRFVDGLGDGGAEEERVILAAGEGSLLYLLAPALRAHEAEVEVKVLGGPDAAAAVRTGEAHLAFGVFDLIPRGLVGRDVVTTRLCVALPTRHRLARRSSLSLADLGGERPIVAPAGQRHRELASRAFASGGLRGQQEPLEADGWPLMLAYAAAGLGVAIVNGTCQPPTGVVLRPLPELGTVTYRLLARRRGEASAAVEALASTICERTASARGACRPAE